MEERADGTENISNYTGDQEGTEPHMRVYQDRFEIIHPDGDKSVYYEGKQSDAAKTRYDNIKQELEAGYLEEKYTQVRNGVHDIDRLTEDARQLIDRLVDGVTANEGRTLLGLTFLQLVIKSIEPTQSIRLPKGSKHPHHFSWKEGISMRSIDNNFTTPFLHDKGFLRLNSDGVFMTRSLAENYPYSPFYKANNKGDEEAWAELVELIEANEELAEPLLEYLLLVLINRGEDAEDRNQELLEQVEQYTATDPSIEDVYRLIRNHLRTSQHTSRLLEVALHSLFQVKDEEDRLDYALKPLTQLRSADKKHGNVGDVELVSSNEEFHIYKAYDAKYGEVDITGSLRDLEDKLVDHPETEEVVFISDTAIPVDAHHREQITSLEQRFDVDITVTKFKDECMLLLHELEDNGIQAGEWLDAYAETLCHQRRDYAPIDEPTDDWVEALTDQLSAQ